MKNSEALQVSLWLVAISFISSYGVGSNIYPKALCGTPISYSIGSFDERFGMPREDIIEYAKEAEQVWEVQLGEQLFDYNPDGDLKINLVYDWRQEAVITKKVLKENEISLAEYKNDSVGGKIDMYRFSNGPELTRVLAHEFGHALGLSHVDDPKALMYRLVNANYKLTAADFAEVARARKRICK